MKKMFVVGHPYCKAMKELDEPVLLAVRSNNQCHLLNFDIQKTGPNPAIEWNGNELVLRFFLKEGDYLALGDIEGTAKKETLDERNRSLQGGTLSST